ncbi:MAG TPA: hypothetical protein VLB90_03430 [Pseudomonadales bacterium]|nr:hypothetical protein [Pseudomonadales bacterium]
MDTPANSPLGNNPYDGLIPLQFFASRYGHATLLDADGNEQPITESMIRSACDDAIDALYSFVPSRCSLQAHGSIE